MLQRADAACFTAKERGRNQVCQVEGRSTDIDNKRSELRWVQRLNDAIENNKLILFTQPITPLNTIKQDSDTENLEVLIRMRDFTNKKFISPGEFIPSAERYGLNTKIDRWVITQLLKTAPAYSAIFDDNRSYWVNLSGTSFSDKEFIGFLESIIQKELLPKGSLNFEITETAIIKNINEAAENIQRLQRLGCKFSLDDFGSGLSSFSYLKLLPVDFLKIDGLFIRNILNDRVDRMFVKSIIDIAKAMNIKTVAEYIEDEDILREVTALGVDYGQGYLLGKPKEFLPQTSSLIQKNLAEKESL